MAVTNIHTIHKGTLGAISYICDPSKTADGRYVISNLCVSSPQGAAEQFADTRRFVGTGRCRNEAQHIIQSFPPGEVTPERALLIGQEICKALFNDEYQYVIATHIDHSHVHNHIIVNNVNFYTGKSFETEHNQGKIPDRVWSKLREVSDEICRKHLLSVIENPEQGKGVSHYEWELNKQKLSWKQRLKDAIDEVIKVSEDFEDFLAKCPDFGIMVDYNPDHKIDLKFILAEQKERNPRAKFTRAKTLGYFYESKQIARRIKSYKELISYTPMIKIIRTSTDKFLQSDGLTNWADRENMKAASIAFNELTAKNSTVEELVSAAHSAMAKYVTMSSPIRELSDRYDAIQAEIQLIEKYQQYHTIYKRFCSLEGKAKKEFGEQCRYELDEHKAAAQKLRELHPDGKFTSVEDLRKKANDIKEQRQHLREERSEYKKQAERLVKEAQRKRDSQKTVKRYIQNEQETKRKKDVLE